MFYSSYISYPMIMFTNFIQNYFNLNKFNYLFNNKKKEIKSFYLSKKSLTWKW